MSEFNQKRTYRKFIYSPFTLLFLVVILVILLKACWGVYQKEKMSGQYLARAQNELEKLTARKNKLEESVEYMKTDKGIEAEIRSKFRVVREGEMVAVIVDNEPMKNVKIATTTPASSGFWKKLRVWFSGRMRPSQG